MPAILGISAHYHDAAAAIVVDGRIVAAAQEERFSRRKHDSRFPERAIAYCLAEAGLADADLEYVAFHDKPLLKFDRFLETAIANAPRGAWSFARSTPAWLNDRLRIPVAVRRALPGFRRSIVYPEHHESHAASAFLPSPFEEAAILTVDGVGEWATTMLAVGRENRIEPTRELRFPHSLGLLYSAFTEFCGFRVNDGEYKLMGLAPFGEPRFAGTILEHLLDLRDDGSFRLDARYFRFGTGSRTTSPAFHQLFGGPPRAAGEPVTERHADLAASIQFVTEEVLLRITRHLHAETGLPNLCLAGGVALNSVANGRLLREGPFERVWVQPAAGDAGGALGAALFVHHQLLGNLRESATPDGMAGALLGPAYGEDAIRRSLDEAGLEYEHVADERELCEAVAAALDDGRIVGWFQGRMEFGPRALGARSLLADARRLESRTRLNDRVKRREPFRPFAPVVLAERANEWFDVDPTTESPYMLLVTAVGEAHRHDVDARGFDRLEHPLSELPAITHVDGSARLQTVDERHGRLRLLLEAFADRTGVPVLLNTSFNAAGEPIVLSPDDAIRCFREGTIDLLVLERFVVRASPDAPVADAEPPAVATAGPPDETSLFRFDREPSNGHVRATAVFAGLVCALLAWWLWSSVGLGVAIAGSAIVVTGVLAPSVVRGPLLLWTRLVTPVGRVLSCVLLLAVYYAVLCPVALIVRVLGHDPLTRRVDPGAATYWIERPPPRPTRDYLRRY